MYPRYTVSNSWKTSLAVLLALLTPCSALAHGRPMRAGALALDPDDPARLVVRTTFGLAVSEDAGASWSWLCAAVYRADPVLEDPAVVVAGGAVVTGGFQGAASAAFPLCDWSFPEGPARDVYVPSLSADPAVAARVWGVASDGRVPDRVLRSDDAGASWQAVGPDIDDVLIESVAAGGGGRLYLSGSTAPGAAPTAYVYRSSDDGESFERTEIPLEEAERFPLLEAVDPTDADRLLVRLVRSITDEMPDRLLFSDDGGVSFTEIHRSRVLHATFASDGQSIFVGSAEGGLDVARGGTFDFERVSELTVRCLEARAGELWLCVDQLVDGFALGVSTDEGANVEPRLYLDQVGELPSCPMCTQTDFICPAWEPDLRADQRAYFGGVDGGMGVSTGLPRDAGDIAFCGMDAGAPDAGPGMGPGGCGCRLGATPAPSAALPLAGLLLLSLRRRRGRCGARSCARSRSRRP